MCFCSLGVYFLKIHCVLVFFIIIFSVFAGVLAAVPGPAQPSVERVFNAANPSCSRAVPNGPKFAPSRVIPAEESLLFSLLPSRSALPGGCWPWGRQLKLPKAFWLSCFGFFGGGN